MRFVGVAWHGDDESFRGFVDEHGLTFPQISDDAAEVFDRFDVPSQPALAFVSPDGSYDGILGAVDDGQLTAAIEALLD